MRIFLLILFFLILTPINGTIIEINTLDLFRNEINNLTSNDLVAFDIDETLVVSKDLVLRPCGRVCLNGLMAQYGNVRDPKKRECLVTQIMLQRKICLVDPTSLDMVLSVQNKGTKVIALTALKTGPYGLIPKMENWRVEELANAGFHFDRAFPQINHLILPQWKNEKHPAIFLKGVLCSCKYPKGEVLVAFLKEINWKPKHVYFIDDRLHNLQSVEKSLSAMNIPFVGYHYTGADLLPGILDQRLAETQLNYFLRKGVWLSDEEATQLLSVAGGIK